MSLPTLKALLKLVPILHCQLRHHCIDVPLHRLETEEHLVRNLFVGPAPNKEVGDPPLHRSQRLIAIRGPSHELHAVTVEATTQDHSNADRSHDFCVRVAHSLTIKRPAMLGNGGKDVSHASIRRVLPAVSAGGRA